MSENSTLWWWTAAALLYLFQAEENSSDGGPKSHRHSGRRSGRQHLYKVKGQHYLNGISGRPVPGALRGSSTSRRFPSFLLYLENRLQKRFPQQQATWTRGPSFPRLRPDDTARTRVTVLISRVHFPR